MGNVEARPHNRPVVEVSHRTARPLPPLPNEEDEIEDDYDLDSPPPYPPPPPPHDENGGKSKRISWRFRDANIFGGLKKGSWALHNNPENDLHTSYADRNTNSQNMSGSLSNTVATEDNSVVTVSITGTPDKNDLNSDWRANTDSLINANNGYSKESSKGSWAVKNMQLVLDKEMQNDVIDSVETGHVVNINGEVANYPYPDVQSATENERSSLPDLITDKNETNELSKYELELHRSQLPYALKTKEVSVPTPTSITPQDVRRVEDIRLDYPEGKIQEVSHYNNFPIKSEGSSEAVDAIPETENDEIVCVEANTSSALEAEAKIKAPKAKKTKLGSCFGKSKDKDDTDKEIEPTLQIKPVELSANIDQGDITGTAEVKSPAELELTTPSQKGDLSSDGKNKTKKSQVNLGSCFGKKKSNDVDVVVPQGKVEGEIQVKSPDIETSASSEKLNLSAKVSVDEPSVEVKESEKAKNEKNKAKLDLGSCFGKKKSADISAEAPTGKLSLDAEGTEIKTDVEFSEPKVEVKDAGAGNLESNIKLNTPNIKTKEELTSPKKKKNKLGSCFGKNKGAECDVNIPSTKLEGHIDINPNIKQNIEVEGDLPSVSMSSNAKDGNFKVDIPEISIEQEAKIDGNLEVPEIEVKDHEGDIQKVDVNLEGKMPAITVCTDSNIHSSDVNIDLDFKDKVPDISLTTDANIKLGDDKVDANLEVGTPATEIAVSAGETSTNISLSGEASERFENISIPELPSILIEKNIGDDISPGIDINADIKDPDINLPDVELSLDSDLSPNVPEGSLKIQESGMPALRVGDAFDVKAKEIHDVEGKIPEIKVKTTKPKVKAKGGFGSCFGKSKKPNDDSELDKTVSVEANVPSQELEIGVSGADVKISQPETQIAGKAKKPKSKLGSCFGKPKAADVDVKVHSSLEGPEFHSPETEVGAKTGLAGSVDVKSSSVEVGIPPGSDKNCNLQAKKKTKMEIGSCFGKKKSADLSVDASASNLEGSLDCKETELQLPEVNVEAPTATVEGNVDIPKLHSDIKLSGSAIEVNENIAVPAKKKSKFPSCFGKQKSSEVEAKLPAGTMESDTNLTASIDVENDLPEGSASLKVSKPKKKKNFGSCFGKNHKGTESDGKLEEHIEIKVPDVSLKNDVQIDSDIKVPNITVKSSDIDVVNHEGIEKVDVRLEGKVPELSTSQDISLDIGTQNINTGKAYDVSLDTPNLPNASVELDVCEGDIKSPSLDINILDGEEAKLDVGEVEINSSNLDIDIPDVKINSPNVDINIPDVEINSPNLDINIPDVEINSPKLDINIPVVDHDLSVVADTSEYDKSLEPIAAADVDLSLEPPNIEIPDVQVSTSSDILEPAIPKIRMESKIEGTAVDLNSRKTKEKKLKGGPCSCLGKPKGKEKEIYLPAEKVEIEGPVVGGEVEATVPSVESKIKSEPIEAKSALKGKSGKSKMNIGSCFGKPKSSKTVNSEAEIEVASDIKAPELKCEIQKNETCEVNVEAPKPKIKAKSGIGSCFGKSKNADIDADLNTNAAIDIAGPSKVEVDVTSGEMKSGGKVEAKKPKANLGACFGKKKSVDSNVQVSKPTLEGSVEVKSPDAELTTKTGELVGSVDVRTPSVEVEVPGGKLEKSKPKAKFSSCFGKKKSISIEDTGLVGKGEGSVEIKTPSVEYESSSRELGGTVNAPTVEVDVHPGSAEKTKSKMKLGSCFGKKKSVDIDVNAPAGKAEMPVSVEVKSPDVEIEAETKDLEGSVDVIAPSVEVDAPSVKLGKSITVKPKSKLSSCFGKEKPVVDIEAPVGKLEGSVAVKSPDIDIKTEKGDLQGSVDLSPTVEVDVPSQKGKKSIKGKPKMSLGSCFGKKSVDVDAKTQSGTGKGSIEVKSTDVEIGTEIENLEGSVNVKSPSLDVEVPSVKVEKQVNVKRKSKLGSCFGKKQTVPDVEVSTGKLEGSLEAKPSDAEFKTEPVELKGSVDISMPTVEIDTPLKNSEKSSNARPKSKFGSCFGRKKSLSFETPKGDLEGSVEVKSPDIEFKPQTEELKGGVEIATPTVEVEVPSAKTDQSIKAKPKMKLGSCFGKKKTIEVEVPPGNMEGSVQVNPGDIDISSEPKEFGGSVDVKSAPAVSLSVPKQKKNKTNLGSCFGKKPKPEASGKIESNFQAEVPDLSLKPAVQIDSDIEVPTTIINTADIDISKHERTVENVILEGKLPEISAFQDISVDVDSQSIDIGKQYDISLDTPDLPSASVELNVGEVDIKSPNLDINIPCVDNNLYLEPDISETAASLNTKVDQEIKLPLELPDHEVPNVEVSVSADMPTPDIPKISLESKLEDKPVDIEGPKIKGKKVKGGPCSCIGKPKGDEKEIYLPSKKVEIEGPVISGHVEANVPSVEGKIEHEPSKDKSPKSKLGKSKLNIGSCFGKPKPHKTVMSEGKVEVVADIKDAELKSKPQVGETSEACEVNVEAPKPKIKAKSGIGSCFGKSKSADIDSDLNTTAAIDIAGPSKVGVDVDSSGEDKFDGKVGAKKPKTNLSSCFGKKKSIGGNVEVPTSNLEGSVEVKSSNAELTTETGELEGSVDIKTPTVEVEVPALKLEKSKPKAKFGSCFGKKKSVDIDIASPVGKGESSVEIEAPTARVEAKTGELAGSVDIEPAANVQVDVSSMTKEKSINTKSKSKLGSCFGKKKSVDIDVQSPTGEIEGSVKSPIVEVEGPNVELEGSASVASSPPVVDITPKKVDKSITVKPKTKLSSCFGKKKSVAGVQLPKGKVAGSLEVKSPDVEIETQTEGALEGSMSVTSPDAELEVPSAKLEKSVHVKPKSTFGSCFGKKSVADVEIPAGKLEGSVEAKPPALEFNAEADELEGAVDIASPKVEVDILPQKQKKLTSDKPKMSLGSCFGKKSAGVNVETPTGVEGSVEVQNPKVEIEAQAKGIEGSMDIKSPTVEVALSSGEQKPVNVKPKSKLGSCFGKKKSVSDVEATTGELEASVEVKSPDVELAAETSKFEGTVDITQSVDVDVPSGKGEKSSNVKPKIKLGSCFGKKKSIDVDVQAPTGKVEGSVAAKSPDFEYETQSGQLEGSVNITSPTVETDVPTVKVDDSSKVKSKSTFGSCFGKKKAVDVAVPVGKLEGSVEVVPPNVESEILSEGVEGSVNVQSPSVEGKIPSVKVEKSSRLKPKSKFGSCFGKKSRADVEVSAGKLESSAEVKSPDIEFKTETQNLEGSVEVTPPTVEISASTEKEKPINAKPKMNLGSCFGKKSSNIEVPQEKVVGSIDVNSPDIDFESQTHEVEGSVKVTPPSVEVVVPSGKIEKSNNAKSKMNFGSCFGKKSAEVDVQTPVVAVAGSAKLESPSVEGETRIGELEGSGNFRSPSVDVDVQPKKKKASLGSCFGKKSKQTMPVEKLQGDYIAKPPDVSIRPDIEIDSSVDSPIVSVDIPNIDIKSTGINAEKVDVALEGKVPDISVSPDVAIETDLQKIKNEIDFDVSLNTPDVDNETDIDLSLNRPNILGETDINLSLNTPDVPCVNVESEADVDLSVKIPEVPSVTVDADLSDMDIKSPDLDLNTTNLTGADANLTLESDLLNTENKIDGVQCSFGLPKLDVPDVELSSSSDILIPEIEEVSAEGEISSVKVGIEPPKISGKVETNIPSVEGNIISESSTNIPNVKAKPEKSKLNLGSCFGKSKDPKSPTAEANVDVPSDVKTSGLRTELKGDVKVKTPEIDVNTSKPNTKARAGIGSCFGKPKTKDTEPDLGKSASIDIDSSSPDAEVNVDLMDSRSGHPDAQLDGKVKKPSGKLGSCFGKRKSLDVDTTTHTPEIEVSSVGDDTKGTVEVKSPTAELSSSGEINSSVDAKAKRPKMKLGSCFGKKSSVDVKIPSQKIADSAGEEPDAASEVQIEGIEGSVLVQSPSAEVDVSSKNTEKSVDVKGEKKPKLALTSCFGKRKSADITSEDSKKKIECSVPVESKPLTIVPPSYAGETKVNVEVPKIAFGVHQENGALSAEAAVNEAHVNADDTNVDFKLVMPDFQDYEFGTADQKQGNMSENSDILNGGIISSNVEDVSHELSVSSQPPNLANQTSNDKKSEDLRDELPYKLKFCVNSGSSHPSYENVELVSPDLENGDCSLVDTQPVNLQTSTELKEEPPHPPKRWYGLNKTNRDYENICRDKSPFVSEEISFSMSSPYSNEDLKSPDIIPETETAGRPISETLSDLQSLNFAKEMIKDGDESQENKDTIAEGKLDSVSVSNPGTTTDYSGNDASVGNADLLIKKLEEFDNDVYNSPPVVKRTVRVKTFKTKEGSDEPEEVLEEFEAEGEESNIDAAKLLMEKLADLESECRDSQPVIKRTVKVKTYKTKEGSDEPEEVIEEFEDESMIPLAETELLHAQLANVDLEVSTSDPANSEAKVQLEPDMREDEANENDGKSEAANNNDALEVDSTDLLIKKIADIDSENVHPQIKRTVQIKTYTTTEEADSPENVIEEYEEVEDTMLDKDEATQLLLKKIADFDGRGISGEPFVKRTVKVKTYKTGEDNGETEVIDEFEHSTGEMSVSEFLESKYPELSKFSLEKSDDPNGAISIEEKSIEGNSSTQEENSHVKPKENETVDDSITQK